MLETNAAFQCLGDNLISLQEKLNNNNLHTEYFYKDITNDFLQLSEDDVIKLKAELHNT